MPNPVFSEMIESRVREHEISQRLKKIIILLIRQSDHFTRSAYLTIDQKRLRLSDQKMEILSKEIYMLLSKGSDKYGPLNASLESLVPDLKILIHPSLHFGDSRELELSTNGRKDTLVLRKYVRNNGPVLERDFKVGSTPTLQELKSIE